MSNHHHQGAHHDPAASANSISAPSDDPDAGMSPTTRRRTIRDQQEGVDRVIKATQASVARSKPRATSPYLRRKSYSPLHLLKPKTVVLAPEDEAMQASILAMIAAPSSPTQIRKPAPAASRPSPVPAAPATAPPPPPVIQPTAAHAPPHATAPTAAPTRPWNGGPGTSPTISRRGSPTMMRRATASPIKGSPMAARRAAATSPTSPHRQRQGTDTVAHQQEPDFVRYCEQKPVISTSAPTTSVAAVQVSLPPTPRPPAVVQLPAPLPAALPSAHPPNLLILTDATRALSLQCPSASAPPPAQPTVLPSTLPRSERSVSWAAPPTDTSPTVRANDYGGIFNEYNEYNHEAAMPRPQQNLSWLATSDDSVAAIPTTSRHASHVLSPQDSNDRGYMSPFANDDERRAFLTQFTGAPSTTATEHPTGRWSPPSLPRRREEEDNDEWRAIERPKSADPWVSSKSVDSSSASMDAKTNSFRATYATSIGTSLSGLMPRSAWLDSSSPSLSLDQPMSKDTRPYRGPSSDESIVYGRSPDTDATAFRSTFADPARPPPSTSEYYRARTPPPPPSAARPHMPPSPPRPDPRGVANRTDATATRVLQDRERHLTEVVHTLKARLEEEQAQSTHLREHVTWLHDRLRAENARRAAADAEVASLRARVMDLEHHARRGGTSGDFAGSGAGYTGSAASARTTEPRPNDEWSRGNGTSGNDPDATWRASLLRTGMARSPTAAATAAPSYRSDSTILAKPRYDDAPYGSERSDTPVLPLPSRLVRHEVDDPYLMP
ncbi:hypothetical protein AMAG_08488 [Allomyces macrogynus ATCC 38327]|uniref:Uncharacterized protein n=1 Tax=Allomyces macrogynus (strain ATCC 38327) TaxID=578462 RepID=A0A0L0SLL8_ALLM3|nr:hypothetical protein AMAG_08488 [Allomyces macrogynus ATCC 38327]|eukprot:KNE63348.1 hypothetical protein AMAG_08488 [Allomyces macrogynus ATCC 38327]